MKSKIGSVCMILGAALILVGMCLFGWNRYEDARARDAVKEVLPQIIAAIEAAGDDMAYFAPEGDGMAEIEIDGYDYIGYLSIPSLGLELPVMADWSYPQLKIAPCRYAGSVDTDDLVIAAHNYSRHFGNIKNLSVKDVVYFTDMSGMVSSYEVAETDILPPAAVDEMTDSGYALTLFTCTYGGGNRVTVRCERSIEH